jgi:hypothetical protein
MSADESPETYRTYGGNKGVSRRGFLRLVGASTATAAVAGSSLQHGTQPAAAFDDELWTAVTRSHPMLGVAEYLVRAASLVTGPGVDDLSNYVGGDALLDALYQKAVEMQSSDDRVYTLMENRLADSKNTAYSKAKIRIAEKLNDGAAKADVKSAARAVNDDYYATIQTNLVNHWNEQILKYKDATQTIKEHSDLSNDGTAGVTVWYTDPQSVDSYTTPSTFGKESITLVDGSTIDARNIIVESSDAYKVRLNAVDSDGTSEAGLWVSDSAGFSGTKGDNYQRFITTAPHDGPVRRLEIWNQIQTLRDEVSTNIGTLVDNVYDSYQSGDITTDDLIDGSTFASQLAAEESDDSAYAMADLVALGVSTNLDGTGVVRLEDSQVTVEGIIGYTGETSFTVGTTYYPTDDTQSNYLSGDVFFAYDGGSGEGTLATADYRGNLDGGVFRLLVAPIPNTTYEVLTVNDETATATASDFTETTDGSGNTVWDVDLSGQLDEPIADVSSVGLYAAEGATSNGLVKITEPFTLKSYTNGDGSTVDSVNVESYNHQSSDSLTAEEIGQLRDALEAYNERGQTDSTSGGGGGSSSSGFLSGSWMGVPKAGWVLGGVGGSLLGYEYLSDDDDERRGGRRY